MLTAGRLGNAALLVAVMVLAVRSFWVEDFVRTPDAGPMPPMWVKSGGGELLVQPFLERQTSDRGAGWSSRRIDEASYLSDETRYYGYGFGFDPHRFWPTVVLPWWSIAMPLTVWPIWWLLWDRMRWRRLLSGRCVGCGYDLTHTDAAACPECGRVRGGGSLLERRFARMNKAARSPSSSAG
ncbi:MAG: hypothetical protein AAF823_12790 [Planctomycetota bacterium]